MKIFVFAIISTAFCSAALARISSGGSSRNTARRHHEKTQMLETNKVPVRRLPNELEGDNQSSRMFMEPCEDCKMIVTKIHSIVQDRAKMQELKAMLEVACDMAPSSYRDECKEVVENLGTVAEELEPLLSNPEVFCREIHLCGNSRYARVLQVFLLFVKKYVYQLDDPVRSNDVMCDECVLVMNEAKTLVESKAIQDDIKKELESLCNMLGSMKDECDSLINEFYPSLIQQLEALLENPRGLCKELGLCDSVKLVVDGQSLFPNAPSRGLTRFPNKLDRFRLMLSRLHTANGMNVGCVMCKFSIGTLVDAMRTDPDILNGMARLLENVCDIMPQQGVRPGCRDFLGMYLKPMLLLTLEEINSRQICQEFHLCSEHEIRKIRENRLNRAWRKAVLCDACTTLADFLNYECRQRSFQIALTNEVKHICDLVPRVYSTQCDNLADQYVPYLLQLFVDELNPNTICPTLHMCSQNTEESSEETGDQNSSEQSSEESSEEIDDDDLQIIED